MHKQLTAKVRVLKHMNTYYANLSILCTIALVHILQQPPFCLCPINQHSCSSPIRTKFKHRKTKADKHLSYTSYVVVRPQVE